MNLETAKTVGNLANKVTSKASFKFVYISANFAPPFLSRYVTTKHEAENYLKNLDKLSFYSVRPGLVVDVSERKFTGPLGCFLTSMNYV